MVNNFGGVRWTNHALSRLSERGISQSDALATFNNPQLSRKGSTSGSWVYYRNWGSTQIEVVGRKNEKGEWVIISVWSRQVAPNSRNFYTNNKPSFWRSLIKTIFNI